MKQAVGVFMSCLLCILLQACAFDVVHLKQIPTQVETLSLTNRSFELDAEVNVHLDTGYDRVLKKGSRWVCVGASQEGDVYRTRDQILTVEGSNIHEAFIVMKSHILVGFYLPVERTFSPLNNPIALSIREIDHNP